MKWDIDKTRWKLLNGLAISIDNLYTKDGKLNKQQLGIVKDVLDRLLDLHIIKDEEINELFRRLIEKGFKPIVDLSSLVLDEEEE